MGFSFENYRQPESFDNSGYRTKEYKQELRDGIKNSQAMLRRAVLDQDLQDSEKQSLITEFRELSNAPISDDMLVRQKHNAKQRQVWNTIVKTISMDDFNNNNDKNNNG